MMMMMMMMMVVVVVVVVVIMMKVTVESRRACNQTCICNQKLMPVVVTNGRKEQCILVYMGSQIAKKYNIRRRTMVIGIQSCHRIVVSFNEYLMSPVTRKQVVWVSDQVRHKSDCIPTEESWNLDSLGIC